MVNKGGSGSEPARAGGTLCHVFGTGCAYEKRTSHRVPEACLGWGDPDGFHLDALPGGRGKARAGPAGAAPSAPVAPGTEDNTVIDVGTIAAPLRRRGLPSSLRHHPVIPLSRSRCRRLFHPKRRAAQRNRIGPRLPRCRSCRLCQKPLSSWLPQNRRYQPVWKRFRSPSSFPFRRPNLRPLRRWPRPPRRGLS